jgi:aminopeptidase N
VSLQRWQDIWLNEGFAVYASWLWLDHSGESTMDDLVDSAQFYGGLDVPPTDPGGPGNLFDATVYFRGALTMYVLNDEIGDDAFFELMSTWVERYGGESVTTADFEALASEVSGKDLTELFDTWLRSDELPRVDDWVG